MRRLFILITTGLAIVLCGCFLTDKAEWEGNWEPLFQTHRLVDSLKIVPPDGQWVMKKEGIGVVFQKLDGSNVIAIASMFVQQLPRKNKPLRQLLKTFKASFGTQVRRAEIARQETGEDAIEYQLVSDEGLSDRWRSEGLFVPHPLSEYHAFDISFSMSDSTPDFDRQYDLVGKRFIVNNLKAQRVATPPSSPSR